MADNYLENQYEQYQARKAAWERERKYGKKKKKSAYPHPLPQQKDAEDVLPVLDEENDNIPILYPNLYRLCIIQIHRCLFFVLSNRHHTCLNRQETYSQ